MNYERIELDAEYGAASELQNAYSLSCLERRPDTRIDEALASDKHVVVSCRPAYCPRTDAAMGEHRSLESVHDTRLAAEEARCRLEAAIGWDVYDETYIDILSPVTVKLAEEVNGDGEEVNNDEVPF